MSVSSERYSIKLFLGLFLLLTTACTPLTETINNFQPETGDFTLFLQPLPQEAHRLQFTISKLVALRADGTEIPLDLRQTGFLGDNLIGVQKKLLSVTLPPGRYLGLKIQIESATLNGEEGAVTLSPPADPILVDYPFTVRDRQAEVLFLSLSADRLVTDGVFFTPSFSLRKPEQPLTGLKGFVSDSGSKNLTIFNKRSVQVVGTVQVGSEPKGLALDRRRGQLYVALAGEDAVAAVETRTSEVVGRVRLRSGDQPTELALSPSGRILLTLNRGSQSVSVIETAALFERRRILFNTPVDDIFIGRDESLAYVIHTDSSSLSVLALDTAGVLNSTVLDNSPTKGDISDDGRLIFLITEFSAYLLVVDPVSLRVQRKIYIGNGARSLKYDPSSGLLYVGKQNGKIAVVDPTALIAIDSYSVPGPVQSLTIDKAENALFAVLPQSRQLLKINLISKRPIGTLDLGADSHVVVVIGER